MTSRAAVLGIVAVISLACSSPSNSAIPSASPNVYLGSLGSAGCQPSAAFHGLLGGDLPEAGMDTSKGSFWALFFTPVPPPARKEIKVVWRMTGAGDFAFHVSDVDGTTIPLVWGPEGHGSSSWNRPGNEVGTGFKFPHAGCWDIHVDKPPLSADLWLEVRA